ncbi:DUF2627 family protein [Exiguobacterium acetylicum]|uniref:DUF2627 family protein n=1 Tax=Exiguobacterium acetylicum TaxID=41170 RepID=UPI001EE20485|nr:MULTISPECIES: DUF2627 family protein [Exiguobacterium]MCY1691871.1 DUF2627 family protein [Exiguobacterium sp. SL14]UKS56968.1 DUF2627 domain-containing protein [Exiguobacterium acetylicum]
MRIIGLLSLLIPGIIGAIGIKLMRDSVFLIAQVPFKYLGDAGYVYVLQGIVGLILAMGGIGFVAGYVFYRDRKRGKVSDRYQKK